MTYLEELGLTAEDAADIYADMNSDNTPLKPLDPLSQRGLALKLDVICGCVLKLGQQGILDVLTAEQRDTMDALVSVILTYSQQQKEAA